MDAREKNIGLVVFGSYEIKPWYFSPYVLDGLNLPEPPPHTKPLRLNGGFSEDTPMEDDGNLTDSTDVDDSMQRLPEASTSSRPASPSCSSSMRRLPRNNVANGPVAARPAALRKEAKAVQMNGRHRSPSSRIPDQPAVQSTVSKVRKEKTVQDPVKLYVCEGCFKYMVHPASYALHFRSCKLKHPPGRKVYQKGAHTIWEVDGEAQKLYCQNLCLFGKLFIDHKYVFFETSGFLFYVLTEGRPSFDHAFGFFSKEKVSYNDYNLACIVTFPPYQKRGYGTLMIEFSYELSSRSLFSRRAGTPERPLSDLGLRGYLQFWTSVLVRYFRLIFHTRNDPRLVAAASAVVISKNKTRKKVRGFQGEIAPDSTDVFGKAIAPTVALPEKVGVAKSEAPPSTHQSLKQETSDTTVLISADSSQPEQSEPSHNQATQQPEVDRFEMYFSLAEIANATDLREDDVAFTLVHSGLANFRSKIVPAETSSDEGKRTETVISNAPNDEDLQVIITPAIVEDIGTKFKVKPPVLSKAHCLF